MTEWMESEKVNKSQIVKEPWIIVCQYTPVHPHFESFPSRTYQVSLLERISSVLEQLPSCSLLTEACKYWCYSWMWRRMEGHWSSCGQIGSLCSSEVNLAVLWIFPTHSQCVHREVQRCGNSSVFTLTVTHWLEQRTLFSTFLGRLFSYANLLGF